MARSTLRLLARRPTSSEHHRLNLHRRSILQHSGEPSLSVCSRSSLLCGRALDPPAMLRLLAVTPCLAIATYADKDRLRIPQLAVDGCCWPSSQGQRQLKKLPKGGAEDVGEAEVLSSTTRLPVCHDSCEKQPCCQHFAIQLCHRVFGIVTSMQRLAVL